MGIGSLLGHLLKGKVLAATAAGALLVGGTTVTLAATSTGQTLIHTITGAHEVSSTGQHSSQSQHADTAQANKKDTTADDHQKECPGLPEAQKLAAAFSLSTDPTSNGIQVICALHEGTFHGKTANGSAVSSDHVFGYGEIDQLLTVTQQKANGKLTESNVSTSLAEALESCGTTPLVACLKNTTSQSSDAGSTSNHGNSDQGKNGGNTSSSGNTSQKNSNSGGDNGKATGRPTSTLTPTAHP